ncbi:hypothetical protein Scep_027607 [Stephania cephalantha]|uniref:RING-type domain-containing protein n=1 Tax=Stephania cephalantha TaxID=152367 RepID=A0AAP0E890_9MAGN
MGGGRRRRTDRLFERERVGECVRARGDVCRAWRGYVVPPVKVDPYITEIDDWICSVESTINDKYYEIARHYHAVKDEDAFREIQMVVEKAKNIAEDARAMGRKKMDMEVRIQVCYEFEYFCDELEMLQLAILESAREEPKFVPASKSAIDKLEKVVLEVDAISDGCCDCRICLEELKVGAEATRMPCSHMFHPSCIVEWLETSHVCPLCRFKLPV